MSTVKVSYDTTSSLTVTNLHSLAASTTTGGWQSAVQDNTSNLYDDALVQIVLAGPTTVASNKVALVYAYSSVDGGTTYSDAASGSEGTITFTSDPPNLVLVGVIPMPVNAGTFKSRNFSIAQAFGGTLPQRWGLVVQNQGNAGLQASGNTVKVQGVWYTVV